MAKRGQVIPHGTRFGRWTLVEHRGRKSLCRCSCGVERAVSTSDIKSGKSKSCGCLSREITSRIHAKPPGTQVDGTPTYRTWTDMKRRCHSPQRPDYHRYGGRGIQVCARWRTGEGGLSGFECFRADMGERPEGMTLDRIDNEGDYTPENCRWATQHEQSNNRRTSRFVELDGCRMTVSEAASRAGVPALPLYHKLNRGLSIEEALKV